MSDTFGGLHFDEHQFAGQRVRPVCQKSRVAWEDYSRMHTSTHKTGKRPHPTPQWVLSDEKVRQVLVAFMEARAWGQRSDRDKVVRKTDGLLQRLDRANEAIAAQHSDKVVILKRLCK